MTPETIAELRRLLDAATARPWEGALRDEIETAERHDRELRAYIAANRGGLAVYWLAHEAKRQGRKTLRVADILAAMDTANEEPQP